MVVEDTKGSSRVKKLLRHSSSRVTETYLQHMGDRINNADVIADLDAALD